MVSVLLLYIVHTMYYTNTVHLISVLYQGNGICPPCPLIIKQYRINQLVYKTTFLFVWIKFGINLIRVCI